MTGKDRIKRGFYAVLVWEVLSFAAFVLNLTANSSDHWWVHSRNGGDNTFVRAGLWQFCFNMYRHRFDYYGKIYHGCWWIFSPEIRLLRRWILTTWLQWVQAFSTLSLISSFFAFIASLLVLRNKTLINSRSIFIASFLHATAGLFMFVTVILFGVYGKRRDWMINWQFNWYGWSFQLAIVSCILHFAAAFFSGYQSMNKILYNILDNQHDLNALEERATLRSSLERKTQVRSRVQQDL